jgi:hypothetical protein
MIGQKIFGGEFHLTLQVASLTGFKLVRETPSRIRAWSLIRNKKHCSLLENCKAVLAKNSAPELAKSDLHKPNIIYAMA